MKKFDPGHFNKILVSMRKDDNDARALFYELYHPFMVTVAYEVLRSIQDAEDVASERFCYFLSKPEQEYVEKPYTWLKTATKNAAVQVATRRRREYSVDFADETVVEQCNSYITRDDTFKAVEFQTDFARMLGLLEDEMDREILSMRVLQKMKLAEIANTLVIKKGNVRYRIKKMQEILKNFYNN